MNLGFTAPQITDLFLNKFAIYQMQPYLMVKNILLYIISFFLEDESNPCSVNPCKNAGKCRRDGSSYTCECYQQTSGKHCENSK